MTYAARTGGPRSRAQAREQKRQSDARRQRWLAVHVGIRVHGRRHPHHGPGTCGCCPEEYGSNTVITDERPYEIVLIDRKLQTRVCALGHEHHPDIARALDMAKHVNAWATMPDYEDSDGTRAIDLVDNPARVMVLAGGHRSGKSELGTSMTLLQWARRGGVARDLFRLQSPSLKQTHNLMAMLLDRLPDDLVLWYPDTPQIDDQRIYLHDGTEIDLRHTQRPGMLKGVRCVWTHWTEASETDHAEAFTITLGRGSDCAGQLLIESTPAEQSHWIKRAILDTIDARETKRGGDLMRFTMASARNPWTSEARVLADREIAMQIDERTARRDFDGEWCASEALLWADVLNGAVHLTDIPPDLRALGLRDRTEEATAKIGRHSSRWILGVDVNRHPTRVLVCKVFSRQDADPLESWGLAVCEVLRYVDLDAQQVAAEVSRHAGGDLRGSLVVMDGTSCHKGRHPEAHVGGRASSPRIDWQAAGFSVMPPAWTSAKKPINPNLRDSTTVVRSMFRARPPRLLVDKNHGKGFWRALLAQEDAGNGAPLKTPNTYADREHCSQTDPLRYLAWALWGEAMYHRRRSGKEVWSRVIGSDQIST